MLAGDHVIAQDTLTREHVSYFRVTWHTSQPSPKKRKKKISPIKILIFQEIELFSSNIKRVLIFSQKKAFLIFSQKKAFLIFPEMETHTFHPKLKK